MVQEECVANQDHCHGQRQVEEICGRLYRHPRDANFFSYDIFVHGSKFQFTDGINLNLTHVCVCCEIIFVFTYIALVVFVYKVKKKKKKSIKILPKMPRMGFEPTSCDWRAHRLVRSATA